MKKILIVLISLILIFGVGFLAFHQFNKKEDAGTSTNEKIYTIITDEHLLTLQNDGGSHHNIYYVIDFNTKNIKKYEDYYVGFKGYEYKDKLIYEKTLNNDKALNFKKVLDEILNTEDTNLDKNYNYFVIKDENEEIKIYNKENINKIKNILIEIDEL